MKQVKHSQALQFYPVQILSNLAMKSTKYHSQPRFFLPFSFIS